MIRRRDLLSWGLGVGALPMLAITRHSHAANDLVSMLEQTPRDRLLPRLVEKKRHGLTDAELFRAICLAGVRQVEPYPTVGFKYHAVMMMSQVHLTRMQFTTETERWLPLLWSADQFKSAQAQDLRGGDWQLTAPGPLPKNPKTSFVEAMDNWDTPKADAAITAWSRAVTRPEDLGDIFEHLFSYGARDLRDIGHKAITVSNCWRVLQLIGWRDREPYLRSTVYALLNHTGDPNPAGSDLAVDRPGRINIEMIKKRLKTLPGPGNDHVDPGESVGFYLDIRDADAEEIGQEALRLLQGGVSEQSIWDVVFMASAELIMQQSTIVPVHATTTVNALNIAYRHARLANTRTFLLLQALSFTAFLRKQMRGGKRNIRFDTLDPVPTDAADPVADIFSSINDDRTEAAAKMLHYLETGGAAGDIMLEARTHIADRTFGYHDYKFVESAFENYAHISPAWRHRYLAASTFYLNSSEDRPNDVASVIKTLLA